MKIKQQGCVLSPDVFLLYSEFVLRAIEGTPGISVRVKIPTIQATLMTMSSMLPMTKIYKTSLTSFTEKARKLAFTSRQQ